MVKAYADCCAVLLADFNKTRKLLTGLLVVLMEIAGINPDLFHDLGCRNGNLR